MTELSVLIIAEDASATFGGEAVLPLHYFRRLRERGCDCYLLTHERNRVGLLAELPGEADRMHFVPDTWLHKAMWRASTRLPKVIGRVVTGPAIKLLSQFIARRKAKSLIATQGIRLVHQPAPVSPKDPSLLFGLGVPVIFGPLNGGMNYPPGFWHLEGGAGRGLVALARAASHVVHWILPGKRNAALILVANERTRLALPSGVQGRVEFLVENGADLKLWASDSARPSRPKTAFVFAGRLVDWKCVDVLLRAFRKALENVPASLDIFGDGVMRQSLEALTDELGLRAAVTFHGWQPQAAIAARLREADVFVLPSVWECGGAVVLEAMAAGLPVIATNWGGPCDYLDDSCGILVNPTAPDEFVVDLADAMRSLAVDPDRRRAMGSAALARVRRDFDWEKKIDRMLAFYAETLAATKTKPAAKLQRSISGSGTI